MGDQSAGERWLNNQRNSHIDKWEKQKKQRWMGNVHQEPFSNLIMLMHMHLMTSNNWF